MLATVRKLGLPTLLARSPGRLRDLVLALLVARVIDAQSKLAIARSLTPETAVSTLGQMLDLGTVDPKELYAAMDWLVERQEAIEQRLAKRHLQEHTLVLYDLTSSYVEGTHCELAQRGHSRDRKKGTLQIVFGLLCTASGCPVAVEVFEGSTSDPNTVAAQVDKIRTRFGLHRVVLVGDRGMLTAARIREDLAERRRAALDHHAARTDHPQAGGCRNRHAVAVRRMRPRRGHQRGFPRRAADRLPQSAARRRAAAQATRAVGRHREGTRTDCRRDPASARIPLRGAAAIGVRVGKVINRYKVAKHFVTTITDEAFSFQRDEAGIADEQQLDGLYIVRSNVEPEHFDAAKTVRAYKDLAKVERAFRSLKTVDLKVRPIHHRRADRVRAHVLLCMLAYYVEWHMRQALKPLLFDDHDPAAADRQRASVVQKAERSPAARAKAAGKRTEDDLPVHSFRTLLADLGTLTANTMRVADGDATFTMLTKPTPVQQRSFELLGVTPQM